MLSEIIFIYTNDYILVVENNNVYTILLEQTPSTFRVIVILNFTPNVPKICIL